MKQSFLRSISGNAEVDYDPSGWREADEGGWEHLDDMPWIAIGWESYSVYQAWIAGTYALDEFSEETGFVIYLGPTC